MIEAGGRKPSFFVHCGESETEDGLWRRPFDDLENGDNSGNNDNDGKAMTVKMTSVALRYTFKHGLYR